MISDPRHRIAVEVLLIDPDTDRAGLLFIPGNVGALIASRNRMDALETIYRDGDVAPRTLQSWLADRDGDDRICQTPRPGDTRITSLETLSSLVLDLRSRTLWATAGPSHQAPYRPYRLS